MTLTVQVFLFRPHYLVRRRLAHSFGYRRAGDAVLGSGYPVRNALSRHPESSRMHSRRSRNGPQVQQNSLAFVAGVGRASEAQRNLTILETREKERGGNEGLPPGTSLNTSCALTNECIVFFPPA